MKLYRLCLVFMVLVTHSLIGVEVYGHRVAAGLLPENSLEAVELAIDLGVHVIDLDITMTRDQMLVCHHDLRLNPYLTRKHGTWIDAPGTAIKELTYDELLEYDVGRILPTSSYYHELPDQEGRDGVLIPKLETVMQYACTLDPNVRFQIEIKTDPFDEASSEPKEIVSELVTILAKLNLLDRVEVHSFDWRNLLLLQQKAPELVTSFLTDRSMYDSEDPNDWLAGHAPQHPISPLVWQLNGKVWCPYYLDISKECVEKAQELGLKVCVWTVDSPEAMIDMIALGVDAIITNRPDILVDILHQHPPYVDPFHTPRVLSE